MIGGLADCQREEREVEVTYVFATIVKTAERAGETLLLTRTSVLDKAKERRLETGGVACLK